MKYKNYYKILNLSGHRASEEEIKNSYRKLTKKYHPDVNPGNEEKYLDITEAYETLSNPRLRKRYNIRYYLHFLQNGIRLTYSKDTIERFKKSEFVRIFIGEFVEDENAGKKEKSYTANPDEVLLDLTLEEAFQGAIKQVDINLPGEDARSIKVRVPRGATKESKVLLRGEGRRDIFTGNRGDLTIVINTLPNSKYTLEGNNLTKELKIAPTEAVLGAERSITSIDGVYKLKIPEGVQNGDVLAIKEAGFINKSGKRGYFLVSIKIDIPKELTKEEKELYAKLRNLHSSQ